jgi:hypothetical protein
MEIKEHHWHFRLYSWFTDNSYEDLAYLQEHRTKSRLTFCQYWRKIILCLIAATLIAGSLGFVVATVPIFLIYCCFNGFAWITHEHLTGWQNIAFGGMVFLCFATAGAIVVGIKKVTEYIGNKIQLAAYERQAARFGQPEKEPGFFSVWYTSFKDKFCPTLEFKLPVEQTEPDSLD